VRKSALGRGCVKTPYRNGRRNYVAVVGSVLNPSCFSGAISLRMIVQPRLAITFSHSLGRNRSLDTLAGISVRLTVSMGGPRWSAMSPRVIGRRRQYDKAAEAAASNAASVAKRSPYSHFNRQPAEVRRQLEAFRFLRISARVRTTGN
jgi:hypothetical protein